MKKSLAQLLEEADDFDGPSYNGRGPRSNVVWWDHVMLPALQRRWRLARAGRVLMRKSVHDEMRLRELLTKVHAATAATARQPVPVVRRSRPNGQQPKLVPTDEELRAAACRRARLALS